MDNEVVLGVVAGAIVSVAFNIIPRLRDKYENLTKTKKQLVMVGFLALAALAWLGASCLAFDVGLACDVTGVRSVVIAFVFAVLGNFGTYGSTKYIFDNEPG